MTGVQKLLFRSITDKNLTTLISKSIKNTIKQSILPIFASQNYVLMKLEKKRLTALVIEWLDFEKQRTPFECISLEEKQSILLDSLDITLRADRIDKAHNNEHIIIDYKSSVSTGIDWFSDKPDAPQLLLYLISSKYPITTIALAQVKANKMLFQGISAKESPIPGIYSLDEYGLNTTWSKQKRKWQEILTNLANEFNQGLANVQPKYVTTCQTCNFQMLCRINDNGIINDSR